LINANASSDGTREQTKSDSTGSTDVTKSASSSSSADGDAETPEGSDDDWMFSPRTLCKVDIGTDGDDSGIAENFAFKLFETFAEVEHEEMPRRETNEFHIKKKTFADLPEKSNGVEVLASIIESAK
jgi:hypothetical protein